MKMITGDHTDTAREVGVYARVSPENRPRLVTLSADLDGRVLKVHVLDGLGDFMSELEALEQRLRRMWGRTGDDFPRR